MFSRSVSGNAGTERPFAFSPPVQFHCEGVEYSILIADTQLYRRMTAPDDLPKG